jgi:hypothetical protein
MDKKESKLKCLTLLLLNLQEKWKLFSQEKEIEHEEFFITDLKNVESGGNFPVFSSFWKLKGFT